MLGGLLNMCSCIHTALTALPVSFCTCLCVLFFPTPVARHYLSWLMIVCLCHVGLFVSPRRDPYQTRALVTSASNGLTNVNGCLGSKQQRQVLPPTSVWDAAAELPLCWVQQPSGGLEAILLLKMRLRGRCAQHRGAWRC